jgi:hypothetical protein
LGRKAFAFEIANPQSRLEWMLNMSWGCGTPSGCAREGGRSPVVYAQLRCAPTIGYSQASLWDASAQQFHVALSNDAFLLELQRLLWRRVVGAKGLRPTIKTQLRAGQLASRVRCSSLRSGSDRRRLACIDTQHALGMWHPFRVRSRGGTESGGLRPAPLCSNHRLLSGIPLGCLSPAISIGPSARCVSSGSVGALAGQLSQSVHSPNCVRTHPYARLPMQASRLPPPR